MAEEVSTPAPAPSSAAIAPPSTDTSAEPLAAPISKAVAAQDFDAFKRERHKERFPDPKKESAPRAAAEPDSDPEPDPIPEGGEQKPAAVAKPASDKPRVLSKEQIAINESIRRAVSAATADLNSEIARLRAAVEPPKSATDKPQAAATATDDPEPDSSDKEKYPDGQFDKNFIKDVSRWQTRQDLQQHERTQAAERQRTEHIQTFETRAAQSRDKLQAALKSDPSVMDGVDPGLLSLRPSIALAPGQPTTFGNAVADWVTSTDYPVELLKHLSDHAEVQRLADLPPQSFLREQGRIEAGFASATKADPTPKEPTKSITSAPEPPTTLGKRPTDSPDALKSAVSEGNFAAYQREKRARGVLHYAG